MPSARTDTAAEHASPARAQELLEQTDHTVDRIAQESGFGTAHALRRHFHTVLHTTPDAYRRAWELGG
ncbi:helix-turn-helix domain-containing protein [Nocardia macrotermitis]|uniref:helix-turn-helix domain-containing protein n=1 Tax=Nocardia macrotermitis TaxID=2585198 RepID=UPI0029E82890|nr:helix-turn-helix domain-containing protein [Nocardia macrotermitis]